MIGMTEMAFEDRVEQAIRRLSLTGSRGEELIAFFRGKLPYEEISFNLKEQFEDYRFSPFAYSLMPNDKYGLNEKLPREWPIVPRIYRFLMEGAQSYESGNFFTRQTAGNNVGDYIELYEQLLQASFSLPVLVSFLVDRMRWILGLGEEYRQQSFYQSAETWLNRQLAGRRAELLDQLSAMTPKARAELLTRFGTTEFREHIPLFLAHMGDSSKIVRESMVSLLGGHPELLDEIKNGLLAKKKAVRESAILILGQWKNEQALQLLAEAYERESAAELKALLGQYLPAQSTAAYRDYDGYATYASREITAAGLKTIDWIPWEQMPPVRSASLQEGDTDAPVRYLAYTYAQLPKVTVNHEGRRISEYLDAGDLARFSLQLLQLWMERGAEAKKKWVLTMAAAHGGEPVVHLLKRQVQGWPSEGRGAIACDAVRALAVSGQDSALMAVDGIARNFKYPQVKEAAVAAFDAAAEELGVERETLADRIVPSHGFSQAGDQPIDYGGSRFTLRLSPRLELAYYDVAGTKLKSLPKPKAGDQEERAAAAAEYVKQLKKSLKATVAIQATRLEAALASGRKWPLDIWRRVFVENPIMRGFAVGLIWGDYRDDDTPVSTFRYMEDGSFNTYEDMECMVDPGARIGLVHPMELGDELGHWQRQLQDYEIGQPFAQLNRSFHRVTELEHRKAIIERFAGRVLHPLSLKGKMAKYGWTRGYVGDGGMYHSYFKEDPRSGIGIRLNFSGAFVGLEAEYGDDAVIKEAFFYRRGSVARIEHNELIDDTLLLKASELPPKMFSEAMHELETITASRVVSDEDNV